MKVILYNIFNIFVLAVEFSTCGIILALKKLQILEHVEFQIFGLGKLNLHPQAKFWED